MEKGCPGYPSLPHLWDNFTERLYDKKLTLLTKSKLTYLRRIPLNVRAISAKNIY